MLKRWYHRVRTRLLPEVLSRTLTIRRRDDMEVLGSVYGGWSVPIGLLDAGSVVYCVGCGEDITFDLALIERLGCEVWAFDPTPRAIAHVERHGGDQRYHFTPVGIWSEDTRVTFYLPDNEEHVSGSIVGLNGRGRSIEVEVRRLETVMREHGHDRIDLLKIDVEGAEYDVLHGMLDSPVRPRVLAVEFDQPTPWRRTSQLIRRLRGEGYELVEVRGWNYVFVRS
ncbi:MAG: FkbM family methyltransferase [Phycisphaeraceae bacterium]